MYQIVLRYCIKCVRVSYYIMKGLLRVSLHCTARPLRWPRAQKPTASSTMMRWKRWWAPNGLEPRITTWFDMADSFTPNAPKAAHAKVSTLVSK